MTRLFLLILSALTAMQAFAADPWLVFQGQSGPGQGKHIVFLSGDEEYRSEEGLPMLAKLLAKHHGFKTTVLFAIDPKTGQIDPNTANNIPGLQALESADLMVILARWRNLPDDQMKYVDAYVRAAKPIVGLRTATHAFKLPKDSTYARYTWDNKDEKYRDGFGRQILGETWYTHHGAHKSQSTKGIFAPGAKDHPILRGVPDGGIWGPTDVYGVRDLPDNSTILVLGQVLSGMNPTDPPAKPAEDRKTKKMVDKNNPMMPVAWARTNQGENNHTGRVFATTMGSSNDLPNEPLRRMIVNACFWALGLEDKITPTLDVSIVGPYEPTMYGFNGYKKGVFPGDLVAGAEDLLQNSPTKGK